MSEEWRPVVDWEGAYEVSDHGRVRSLDRIVKSGAYGGTRPEYGRIIAPQPNGLGRYQVGLSRNGKQYLRQVHRLVAAAFIGPCPLGLEVLHWDDDASNNHLSNLRYGTRSDNCHDAIRNGRHANASKTECIHGHEFKPENTYWDSRTNKRQCKRCRARLDRESKARRRSREIAAGMEMEAQP